MVVQTFPFSMDWGGFQWPRAPEDREGIPRLWSLLAHQLPARVLWPRTYPLSNSQRLCGGFLLPAVPVRTWRAFLGRCLCCTYDHNL